MKSTQQYKVIGKKGEIYLAPPGSNVPHYLYIGAKHLQPHDILEANQFVKVLQARKGEQWVSLKCYDQQLAMGLPYETRYILLDNSSVFEQDQPSPGSSNKWISMTDQLPEEMEECFFVNIKDINGQLIKSPVLEGLHVKNGLFRSLHAKSGSNFRPTHWMPMPTISE